MFGLSGSELRREVKDVLLEIDVSVERWNPVEPVEPAYEVEGLSENDDVFVLVVARVVVVLARVGLGDDDDDGVEGVCVMLLKVAKKVVNFTSCTWAHFLREHHIPQPLTIPACCNML